VQLGFLDRKGPAHAVHHLLFERNAQVRKCGAHHARVVGVEETADLGPALGEPRKEQHAVGDALRAGQRYRAGRAANRR
jgi:hypothetical protein